MTTKQAEAKAVAGISPEDGGLTRLRAAVMPGSKVYVLKVGPVGRAFHARLFVVERGEISEITALAVRAGVSGKLKGPKAADYAAVVTLARSWSKQDCQIAAEALASVLGYTPEAFVGEAL